MNLDEVAVQRAMSGDRSVPLSRAEVAEAHRRLRDAGASSSQVADVLGVSLRTVHRWNQHHHAPRRRKGQSA